MYICMHRIALYDLPRLIIVYIYMYICVYVIHIYICNINVIYMYIRIHFIVSFTGAFASQYAVNSVKETRKTVHNISKETCQKVTRFDEP